MENNTNVVQVCVLVKNLEKPHVPSIKKKCDDCGELCWHDKVYASWQTVCIGCFGKRFKELK